MKEFMTKKELRNYKKNYIMKDGMKNGPSIILSKHMERPIYSKELLGNNNILLIGDRKNKAAESLVLANLLQMNGSYIALDTTKNLISKAAPALLKHGYNVKVLNLLDTSCTNSYNPFAYFYEEADITEFINTLLEASENLPDKLFENSLKILLSACILYVKDHCKEKNMDYVLQMLRQTVMDEAAEKTAIDMAFEKLPKESMARKYYTAFMQSASPDTKKTIIQKSIILLSAFDKERSPFLNQEDEFSLKEMAKKRTVIFIHPQKEPGAYDSIVNLFLCQIMNTLYRDAANIEKKYHLTFMMHQFYRLNKLTCFTSRLFTLRNHNSSAIVAIETLQEFKTHVGSNIPNWINLMDSFSTRICLGTKDQETQEIIINKLLLAKKDYSDAEIEEIQNLDGDRCVVLCQNLKPVFDKTYPVKKHPLYYLSEYPVSRKTYKEFLASFESRKE